MSSGVSNAQVVYNPIPQRHVGVDIKSIRNGLQKPSVVVLNPFATHIGNTEIPDQVQTTLHVANNSDDQEHFCSLTVPRSATKAGTHHMKLKILNVFASLYSLVAGMAISRNT